MLTNIFLFEIKYRFKKISTYIFFSILMLFGFIAIYRGSIGRGFLSTLTSAGIGNININAPYALYYLVTILSNYGLIFIALYFGYAAYKDFKEDTYALYFSYPIKKIDYIMGRFLGALFITMFVFSGIGVGALIGSISPITNMDKIAELNAIVYLQPFLIGVLPNVIFAGALFFSLCLLTRKFFPVYMGIIILLILYLVAASLRQNIQDDFLASIIDPFGNFAARSFYDYWSIAQKNTLLIPLSDNLLLNRFFWLSIAISILIFTYRKFDFSFLIERIKNKLIIKENNQDKKSLFEIGICNQKSIKIFDFFNNIKQVLHSTSFEFKSLTKNIYFLIIILVGIVFIFILGFQNVGLVRGTQTYPLTSQVLETTKISLYLFNLIIVLFASGELVWRERNIKIHEIFDILPIPEWVPFFGKLGALILVQVLIVSMVLLCGISIQILHGYFQFEFDLYIKELFFIRLSYFLLISVFAMFIQVIINKKFIGYIITFLLVDDFMPALGFEHHLWRFASTPYYIYSDMNGYGPFVNSILFFKLFWFFLAIFFISISILMWVRGNDVRIKDRIKTISSRLSLHKKRISSISFMASLLTGCFIIFNTNILNTFESKGYIENKKADYEKYFKKYDRQTQPQMIDIKLNVDLFPDQRKVKSKGQIVLENKTDKEIKILFVQCPEEAKLIEIKIETASKVILMDKNHNVYIYQLNSPLKPEEKINLSFNLEIVETGFKNHEVNTGLVKNGSFLYLFELMPAIGYDPFFQKELKNNDIRLNYGLQKKQRIPSINDKQALRFTPVGKDGNWINFEAIVSTSKDQIALTCGNLVKKWIKENRHYFHYKTRNKILKYFAVVSAEYTVFKDLWENVSLEIYHHKNHDYNLELMIRSAKKSLQYLTENFSPYQFNYLRIVEFPRYELYAEAFPGLITQSEGYGFISKFDSKKVDYVFRVIAHEVAHQWWGHQVMGANVEGMFILSEALAQYSALMITKKEYNQNQMNDYIKTRIDFYLRGRARETYEEVPLLFTNSDVWYINYEKGIVVMNALQDYLGEAKLNKVLSKYIEQVAFQNAPFTTSVEFLHFIKDATPDSLKYIITDMFESITLYDNKAFNAAYKRIKNGKFLVKFKFETNKFRADSKGKERSIGINDYITIGIFGSDGEELYLKKHWIYEQQNEFNIIVDKLPEKAGIDPYYYLIDKNTDNNLINIKTMND